MHVRGIGRAYCPWEHAEDIGVTVVEGWPLRPNRWGEYSDDRREILLARGLTHVEARCTLAHEVQHAVWRDRPTTFGGLMVRQESRAHLGAAMLLVARDEYEAAEALFGPSIAGIARELDVVPEVIQVYRARMMAAV